MSMSFYQTLNMRKESSLKEVSFPNLSRDFCFGNFSFENHSKPMLTGMLSSELQSGLFAQAVRSPGWPLEVDICFW